MGLNHKICCLNNANGTTRKVPNRPMADPCGSHGSNSHGKLWWLRLRPFVSAISGWIWLVHRSDPSMDHIGSYSSQRTSSQALHIRIPNQPGFGQCLINQDLVSANVGLLCLLSLYGSKPPARLTT